MLGSNLSTSCYISQLSSLHFVCLWLCCFVKECLFFYRSSVSFNSSNLCRMTISTWFMVSLKIKCFDNFPQKRWISYQHLLTLDRFVYSYFFYYQFSNFNCWLVEFLSKHILKQLKSVLVSFRIVNNNRIFSSGFTILISLIDSCWIYCISGLKTTTLFTKLP